MEKLEKGLVQIYTGEGKGVTALALGLALRAVGHGFKVFMIQFFKGNRYSSEVMAAETYLQNLKIDSYGRHCPYIDLMRQGLIKCSECKECYVLPNKIKDIDRELAQMALEKAIEVIESKQYNIVILDEINRAVQIKLISEQQVIELIKKKPPEIELILTGNKVPAKLEKLADTIIEIVELKSLPEKDKVSRPGLEY